MCGTDCFLMLLSFLFPPIGVWVKKGVCGADSLINIALCCLGFLPGMIHAWYIILQNPEHEYDYERVGDGEGGRVTYYRVSHGGPQQQSGNMDYGTVGGSRPGGGQFPGQQTGVANQFAQQQQQAKHNAQAQYGVAGHEIGSGGEGSQAQSQSQSQPSGPPPTYADAVKGDHKVQKP